MNAIKIASTRDYFTLNTKPFFYLADTVWTAFSNISFDEWDEYLDLRRMQGFNALQINILTVWDAGVPDTGLYPFKIGADGKFDFFAINDEYFARAQTLLDIAVAKGFVPNLALLWGNYASKTWQVDEQNPTHAMPSEAVRPYLQYVLDKFSRFNPLYMISGDISLDTEPIIQFYKVALDIMSELAPHALVTMHMGCGTPYLPDVFMHSGYFGYYLFQSGHAPENNSHCTYDLPLDFYKKPVKRPILNGEPCYEASAFAGHYGRYNAFDIRRAFWQGILSGAKAGFSYGAQGVWGWYKEGKPYHEYGGKPIPWRKALDLPGAWDAGFGKWLYEMYGMWALEPVEDGILNDTQEIRISKSADGSLVVIYYPYDTDVLVNMDLSGYACTSVNLADKRYIKPDVRTENGKSAIKINGSNSDMLFIAQR